MVFYILDTVFKEFEPLPYVDSNLCRRWAYFPDNEIIRNSFNWHQNDINQRNKRIYDIKKAKKIPTSEYMKPDVVYSVGEFFQDNLHCQNHHVAKRDMTAGLIVISCEHKMLLGEKILLTT